MKLEDNPQHMHICLFLKINIVKDTIKVMGLIFKKKNKKYLKKTKNYLQHLDLISLILKTKNLSFLNFRVINFLKLNIKTLSFITREENWINTRINKYNLILSFKVLIYKLYQKWLILHKSNIKIVTFHNIIFTCEMIQTQEVIKIGFISVWRITVHKRKEWSWT